MWNCGAEVGFDELQALQELLPAAQPLAHVRQVAIKFFDRIRHGGWTFGGPTCYRIYRRGA